MGRRVICLAVAIAFQCMTIVASAQHLQGCAIATHTEKISGGTIVYNPAGTGPSILLVHGLFANKEQWRPLAWRLADAGYQVLAVDLPGYGKSHGYSLTSYRLANEVESLAGIDDPARHQGTRPRRQLDVELQLLFVTPPAIPEEQKKAIIADYVRRNRHYVQVWNVVNLYNDILKQRLPARKPTLIIWGDDDHVYNVAGAEKLQRRIPGSSLHHLPHAGHVLHLENAAEVAPIYIDFLRNGGKAPTLQ